MLRLKQNGCDFADNFFNFIFLNENLCILIQISLKFVPRVIDNQQALVHIMVWHQKGDEPLFESTITFGADKYLPLSAMMS